MFRILPIFHVLKCTQNVSIFLCFFLFENAFFLSRAKFSENPSVHLAAGGLSPPAADREPAATDRLGPARSRRALCFHVQFDVWAHGVTSDKQKFPLYLRHTGCRQLRAMEETFKSMLQFLVHV